MLWMVLIGTVLRWPCEEAYPLSKHLLLAAWITISCKLTGWITVIFGSSVLSGQKKQDFSFGCICFFLSKSPKILPWRKSRLDLNFHLSAKTCWLLSPGKNIEFSLAIWSCQNSVFMTFWKVCKGFRKSHFDLSFPYTVQSYLEIPLSCDSVPSTI